MIGRRLVSRKRDGTFTLNLDEDEQEILAALADQLDPLLDDPSADPGLRRLFPPARTDDLLAEAQWEIEQGAQLRDARRAALEVVRTPADGRIDEDDLIAWMQGVNALRLVLAERLEVGDDQEAEEEAIEQAFAIVEDPESPAEQRARARRILGMWQVYQLLAAMVSDAVDALD